MKMKLSEAIFLGASMTKQSIAHFFEREHEVIVATCALGGALLAVGVTSEDRLATQEIGDRWPWALMGTITPLPCPHQNACYRGMYTSAEVIAHLNDAHQWSRERIADWVATIEPKDEPTPAVELEKISTEFTGNPQEKEKKELTPA